MKLEQLEKSILGTLLTNNYFITDGNVYVDYFQKQTHQMIFKAMQNLAAQGRPIDYATLLTTHEPSSLGGSNYVAELSHFSNSVKFDDYVAIIRTHWLNREKHNRLFQATQEDWSIAKIQQELDALENSRSEPEALNIKMDLVKMAERPYIPLPKTNAVPTGLQSLDKLLNGFQPAELTIIAARPSMGKTDVLNHFALHAGLNHYLPIIFSLEMSKKSMIDRLISALGDYNRLRMRDPYQYFSEEQKSAWLSTLKNLNEANIHIDDRAALTVPEIRAAARKVIRHTKEVKPIIFIDYLQIIRSEERNINRSEMIGQISSHLKAMAKEFNCPVVCLSQLNRSVESRDNKRPILSDLRDSGNIEQDADVIGFLYRDCYYNPDTPEPNILEINIAKNRNGPTGQARAYYALQTGQMIDLENRR